MDKLRRKLANWLLADILRSVDDKKILSEDAVKDQMGNVVNSTVKLGGKPITEIAKYNLKKEAEMLKEMEIWQIFQHTITEDARKRMAEKATGFDDMYAGKTLLYSLDVLNRIVERLSIMKVESPKVPPQ